MGPITPCKHNSNVDCQHQVNCNKCGWNPEVAQKRLEKIKNALQKKEAKKKGTKKVGNKKSS